MAKTGLYMGNCFCWNHSKDERFLPKKETLKVEGAFESEKALYIW